MDSRHKALEGLELRSLNILEIGPLNRPLVPRSSRYAVYYADHCSTDVLRRKYSGNPDVPVDDIVSVDFDLSLLPIRETTKVAGKFDLVVASHVIEHVPDFVGWLRDIADCLLPGGILALVVPDKRYSFDVFRRETEAWMIDEAAEERRTRPSLRQVIEHFTCTVSANTAAMWEDPSASSGFRPSISIEAIESLYIDAHCWIITPQRFISLMKHSIVTYGIPLEEFRVEETNANQLEFYAQYRRTIS